MPEQSDGIIGAAHVAVKAIRAQRANSGDNNVNIGCSRSLRPYSREAGFAARVKWKEAGFATGLQQLKSSLRRLLALLAARRLRALNATAGHLG